MLLTFVWKFKIYKAFILFYTHPLILESDLDSCSPESDSGTACMKATPFVNVLWLSLILHFVWPATPLYCKMCINLQLATESPIWISTYMHTQQFFIQTRHWIKIKINTLTTSLGWILFSLFPAYLWRFQLPLSHLVWLAA